VAVSPLGRPRNAIAQASAAGVTHHFVHYTDRGHMGITDEVVKEARAFIASVEPEK
jgi:hypothetical protein